MPSVFTLEGAQAPIYPTTVIGLNPSKAVGDVTSYLKQFPPAVSFGMALGLSLVTGLVVGSATIWVLKRAGYKPREA